MIKVVRNRTNENGLRLGLTKSSVVPDVDGNLESPLHVLFHQYPPNPLLERKALYQHILPSKNTFSDSKPSLKCIHFPKVGVKQII